MEQQLTFEPAVLASLDEGTSYTLQNKSKNKIYIQHSDSIPVGVSGAFELVSDDYGIVKKLSGNEIYVWGNFSSTISAGLVVYDEVA